MSHTPRTDHDLMVRAAWMYYQDDLTHAEIARKLYLSRVKVTRLLKRAREQGIVEIRVVPPMPPDMALSREIEATFGVQAVVVPNPEAMARAAADLLVSLLEPGLHIGFGWSSTVSQLADHLPAAIYIPDCVVADLVGNMLGKANPYSISGRVAEALGAKLMPLAVPALVSAAPVRNALLGEDHVQTTLAAGRASTLAFVGVGEVGATSTLVQTGFLTPEDITTLEARGAVGDMLLHCFDIDGTPVTSGVADRILGVGWDDLQRIPNVVLMAHGPHKIKALLGALRSKAPDTLITDMITAANLLEAAV